MEQLDSSLIIRTSAFFGPEDTHNFVTRTLELVMRGEQVRAASDGSVSPTYVPHLVDAALDLLIDGASGIWHLANRGSVSWYELACRAASALRLPGERIVACRLADLGLPAPRPLYSVLASERGFVMPTLDEAIERYVEARARVGAEARA
jgi:dTDP-4-dehydrorhamnose reductase